MSNPFQINPEEDTFTPQKVVVEIADEEDDDDDTDMLFKDQSQNSATNSIEDVANKDLSQTSIHFKIVNQLVDDSFLVPECTPSDTLQYISRFCPFKLPPTLAFYLGGKRLPASTLLRTLPRKQPILIYTETKPVH
jgi:hypothetical protein